MNEAVISLFESCHGDTSTIKDLTKTIGRVLQQEGQCFIVVDAVDECLRQNKERKHFFDALNDIKSMATKLRIFFSSRSEPDIDSASQKLGAVKISMDHAEINKDIRLHVRSQLAQDESLMKWNARIKQQIEDKLTERANGM